MGKLISLWTNVFASELPISCKIFQSFSNVVAHIVRVKSGRDLLNYLDDYFFAAFMKAVCNKQVKLFLQICKTINFPVAMEKTFWGTTRLVFLGLLIDTVLQIVAIPKEKIEKALTLIGGILEKKSKKVTVKNLQKVCGFLNFIGRSMVPGRAFTRRLYAFTRSQKGDLKPHHHVRVNTEMRSDLEMWTVFLRHPTAYYRPFMDFSKVFTAQEIDFYTDASKNRILGFGGVCGKSWISKQWDADFVDNEDPSIEYLELYTVVVAVLLWLKRFANRRIVIFVDNQAVVHMINKTSSSCHNCMVLIRILVLESMIQNVRVFAKYVRSKDNIRADLLSRMRINDFRKLGDFDEMPTEVPQQLWPIEKIWIK